MKPPTHKLLRRILEALNWQGHVELGTGDIDWLAAELAVALNPRRDRELCEVCDAIKPIVVVTALGRICADCIDDASEEAEAQEEILRNE